MNESSEQLRSDLSLDVAPDDCLRGQRLLDAVQQTLGYGKTQIAYFNRSKYLIYTREDGLQEILLLSAISFLGGNGNHPLFKKRVQLKHWFKDICTLHSKQSIRFIGVYHYKGNIIFVEFLKETYLVRKMHNSSAFVYINDLYQAMKNGIFRKTDINNNKIVCIQSNQLTSYLNDKPTAPVLFDLFTKFNKDFPFNQTILGQTAITKMQNGGWSQWRQTEWAGWFVEFLFNSFITTHQLSKQIQYTGLANKANDQFDFDIYFPCDCFYGDLKASNQHQANVILNDQAHFINCINQCGRFWYVIYEHTSASDSTHNNNFRLFRDRFIHQLDPNYKKAINRNSKQHRDFKYSVNFQCMLIIELNRINYRDVLGAYNQGRQPDGSARKSKYLLNKHNIDNLVVYRY
ncbi:MAG: hypothetical protein RR258_03030 [Alistipes sp.]